MAFIKHVGKHNNRKVVILYRQVPGEDHMALCVYTDTLPSNFHDSIMNVLESNEGQSNESFAEVLFRNLLPDGRAILPALHQEGFIKKVQANQIIVTPTAKSSVRLDELNDILNGMATGEEATAKMKELDDNAGLVDPTTKRQKVTESTVNTSTNIDPLSDAGIAKDLFTQSERMIAEAEGLLAESARLREEAYNLDPSLNPKKANAKKKSAPKKRVATKAKA
jgi:hypothetical protein